MFAPVIDERSLLRHPFNPTAPEISANVPLLIGTTAEETRSIMGGADQTLFSLDEAELRARLQKLGLEANQLESLIDAYRVTRPQASPSDIFFAITGDLTERYPAIVKAERKAMLAAAPAYMYLFTWEIPAFGGKYGAAHGMELPYMFDNIDAAPGVWGGDPHPQRYLLSENVSRAWVAFARTGNPSHSGLPEWKSYTANSRATMLLNYTCELVNDPKAEDRLAMQRLEAQSAWN